MGDHNLDPGLVLFLGMVRRGEFESLQNHGLPLGVIVDTNNKQRLADVSGFKVVERFDFSRPLQELIALVRGIQQRFGVACLFNVVEFYVAQTADVASALGLPGVSPESARLCLDKSVMRQRFVERIGPSASARFSAVSSKQQLVDTANAFGFPVFLQPANVSASMWATRNTTKEMLLNNYRAICQEVPAYYERLGKGEMKLTVVAAEYLNGPNTSVDCLIDRSGSVSTTPPVDVLTGQDIGIDDYHHFARLLPSRLTEAEQQELQQLAIAGCRALDMTTSAAHVEFIGTKLGEIAARPGGNRPRILEMAYGIDMLYAYYQALRGQTPNLERREQRAAAIVTPFARRQGALVSIRHLHELVTLPGYHYHEVRAQPGQPVGLAKGGYRAPLYVELMSENADEVRRSADRIAAWSDLYEVA